MPTLMQAIERAREIEAAPVSGPIRLRSLNQSLAVQPPGSIRGLISRILDGISMKRPWLVILCRFKNELPNPAVENPIEQFYRDIFTPGSGGLVEYWRDVTLGKVDITGSLVVGWFQVETLRSKANTGSGADRTTHINAALAAAQASGVPVNNYFKPIAVYTENWSVNNVPPGLDWQDPTWGSFWIDGSADGQGRVCLTPPHNGNICAHEMGHGFGMNHDLGADLTTNYQDPCCILSQNNAFNHPRWMVPFGPSLCIPHLVNAGWMFKRRLYFDEGGWMQQPDGITLPLAPLTDPGAHANLGIRLAYRNDGQEWDYIIEYVNPIGWDRGIGKRYVFIRRMPTSLSVGQMPAFLGLIEVPSLQGQSNTFVEPAGNVRFRIERFTADARILKVQARKL